MLPLKCSGNCSKGTFERSVVSEHFQGLSGGMDLARALRNHNVWLVLTYVGLILLMARTYA